MIHTSNITNDPAYEYETDAYITLQGIFEEMIDTVYEEASFKEILSNILADTFTLKPLEDSRYNVLLSIYYKEENILEFCFCIKDGLFYAYDLYREKDDLEKFIDIMGERLMKIENS